MGKRTAATPAIMTVRMIILNPEVMFLSMGNFAKAKLEIIEIITIPAMILLLRAGGIITAINIP